jgi:hypothetical protein
MASTQAGTGPRRHVSTPLVHTGKHPRGRKGEDGREVLTLGRRCSRGWLGVVVHVGDVDVLGGGALSALAPWTRTTPTSTARRLLERSLLAFGFLDTDGAPVPLSVARAAARPFFSPSSLLSAVEQGKGKNPKWVVEDQQGLGFVV